MSKQWTLLLTGPDHGLVGAFGNQFVAHPDWYERVDVVRADNHAKLVEALREVAATLEWQCHGRCRGFGDGPIMTSSAAVELARTLLAQLDGD